jgi:hypothetical protein
MSKNTSHYNWNLWSSKNKKLTERKKVLLKEIEDEYLDMIMPAILAAGEGRNQNFAPYFKNENRIVIPYDESKLNYIVTLAAICYKYVDKAISYQIDAYRKTDVYKQDQKQVDTILLNLWDTDSAEYYRQRNLFGNRYPELQSLNLNISKKETIQTGVGAGGIGTVERKVIIYEPVLEYKITKPILLTSEKYSDQNRQSVTNVVSTFGEILRKNGEKELFDQWNGAKGLKSLREMICQDAEVVQSAKEIFDKTNSVLLGKDIGGLKIILKGVMEAKESEYSIVISRTPIDVLRMADFKGMSSCHSPPSGGSEGGSYFYCALAESRNQGAIAYLVKTEDLEKVNLKSEEIFIDYDRGIGGIQPISRLRIRRVVDEDRDLDYMVPEEKVYGVQKSFFYDSVSKWAMKQQKDLFVDGDDIYVPEKRDLSYKGGSYSDSGESGLAEELRKIIEYSIKINKGDEAVINYKGQVNQISRLAHTGEEDEDEVSNQCGDAEASVDYWESQFRRASYVTTNYEVDCNGRALDEITVSYEFAIEITDEFEFNNKTYNFSKEKLMDIVGNRHFEIDQGLSYSFAIKFEKYLKSIPRFKDLYVDYNLKTPLHFYKDSVFFNIEIQSNFPAAGEVSYFNERFANCFSNYELYEFYDVCIEFLKEHKFYEDSAFDKANKVSIQTFAEDLFKTRNHFRWNESDSEEGKNVTFSLIEDPEGKTADLSPENNPIVGIIPYVYKKRWAINDAFADKTTPFQRQFRYRVLQTLKDGISYGQQPLGFMQSQPYTTNERENTGRTPSAKPPDWDNITSYLFIDEDTNFLTPKDKTVKIRVYFDITLDQQMSENELIGAMNYMDIYGSEKYDELMKILTDAFKETWKEIGDTIIDKDTQRYHAKMDTPEPSSANDYKPLESGVKTGQLPLYTMDSVEQPENKNESKQGKKLVINERFKRLLRNIKK